MNRPVHFRGAVVALFLQTAATLSAQTPNIASWSPSHAAPGAVISIQGANLSTAKSVTFNGVAGTDLAIQSAWGLTIRVPQGAATGPVTVTNATGSYTASVNFTVDGASSSPGSSTPSAAPSISSYSPSHAPVGTQISIAGANLGGTTVVYFNGVASTALSGISAWGVTATVPSGASTGPIKIVTSGGTYSTSSSFKVDPPPPTISSWSPSHGPVGTAVTIAGANLLTASSVTFNGVAGTGLKANSDWSVTVTVPAGASTGPVKITNGAGSYQASVNFTVDGASTSGGGGSGSSSGSTPTPPPAAPPAAPPTPTSFIAPPAFDPPSGVMTGHPRIFVRQQDLSRLQSWAVTSNPVWNDLLSVAVSAKTAMDGGALNSDSGNGVSGFNPIETYAELFAFMSLIHPDPVQRADYAKRAHDIVMRVMNAAVQGQAAGQPYRDPLFAVSNRASWYGEAFPVVIDWTYSQFSAAEKATIRKVFLRWIQENLVVTSFGDHPKPVGTVNDPSLVAARHDVRESTNNYYANHARHIGLMSMALDAADDVPASPADPAAGTLRRFVGNAIGAWLYVQNQYEQTDGAGGVEPEGQAYGELSMRGWAFLLLAMHTTGADSPVFGQHAGMFANAYWTQQVPDATLNLISPAQTVQDWTGPAYLPFGISDDATYKYTDQIRVLGPIAIYARNTGNTALYNKVRWMTDNLPAGSRSWRITSALSYTGSLSSPIFYYLATDPNVASGVDPRPTETNDYFAPGTGVLLSRTDRSANASWLTYKLTWNAIDHQHGDGNSIGWYRGGEWLTMPASGYGDNIGSSDYQNTLAIQNPGNSNDPLWAPNQTRGSQWEYDPNGDPSAVTHSGTPAYTFIQGDSTNLYNNPTISALDVQHASRSVLWLKPDAVVIYDRATTGVAGRFKRFHLNTPALASVNGRSASVTTPGGQHLYMDALLPANATLTSVARGNDAGSEPAAGDPVPFRLWSEDLTLPADVRFLNILQGTGSQAAKLPVSLLQSASGTPFDGAVVGTVAVMFRRDIVAPFTNVTFSVPAGVANVYLSGLTPGAGYSVFKTTGLSGTQYTITAGGQVLADQGGVLSF
jgi:hypothetical protein